ncbi:hypothetical protein [Demequina silvatica]|uniref:hypothetical protein n=1 Tax=Demequina silvatica TaxID=1638988 RepID=UPI000AD758C1|nr:hypothetical protein [Demequina silvatica]
MSLWRSRSGDTIRRDLVATAGSRLAVLPVSAISALLTARLVVEATGAEQYGLISLIGQLFLMLPFADLGLGVAVARSLARRGLTGHDARIAIVTLIRTYRILVVAAMVACAAFFVLARAGTWAGLLGVEDAYSAEVNKATAVSLSIFVIAVPLGLAQRVLIGAGRTQIVSLGTGIAPVASLLLTVLSVALGVDSLSIYAVIPAIGVLVQNAYYFVASWRVSINRYSVTKLLERIDYSRLPHTQLWASAVAALILSGAYAVQVQSGKIVVAHVGTALDLSEYAMASQLYQPLASVVFLTGMALVKPFSARIPAAKDYWRSATVLGCVAISAGIALVLAGPWLVSLMSGGQVPSSLAVLGAFGFLLMAQALTGPAAATLTDPRGIRQQAFARIIGLAISIPAAIALAKTIGPAGPPLAAGLAIIVTEVLGLAAVVARRRRAALVG